MKEGSEERRDLHTGAKAQVEVSGITSSRNFSRQILLLYIHRKREPFEQDTVKHLNKRDTLGAPEVSFIQRCPLFRGIYTEGIGQNQVPIRHIPLFEGSGSTL